MECRVRLEDGRPRLFVDGRPRPPLIYSSSVVAAPEVARFARQGVDLVSFPCTADHHLYHLARSVWTASQTYDYGELDERLALIMDANPRAYVLPRVFLCSPPWWDAAHPEDLVVWDNGRSDRPLFHGASKNTVPSLASERWRRAMRENVTRLVRHVEDGPFGDRVLGYMINSENSEEWFHWGTMEGYLFDYNPQVLPRFRDWLRRRYAGDADALSTAWGRNVDFDTAPFPAAAARRRAGGLSMREPGEDGAAVDAALFLADLIAGTIRELAGEVKRATGGRKLFGTFFGYLVELAYHPDGIQNGGHLGLRQVLDDPNVDFLASPSSYARRFPADGYSMSMGPAASVSQAGKVFFHENDVRTHVLADDAGYGRCDSAHHATEIQWREFAHALTHGHGMWWFDMTSGWYDDPMLEAAVARIVEVARDADRMPRRSAAEIALVVDADSMPWVMAPPNQLVQLLPQQALELSRAGAPFDVVLLEDLERLEGLKFVVFANLFRADATRRRAIRRFLGERRITALFAMGAGFVDATAGAENGAELTGIAMSIPEVPCFAMAEANFTGRPIRYGTPFWHGHLPVISDDAAEVLGRYVDSGGAALARKQTGGFTSIVSGAPAVAGAILRRFAEGAGCHLYVDGDDAVYACSRFVAVHARTSGVKQLRVPGAERVFDLRNDVEIIAKDGAFEVYLARGDTALWFRGSAAEWRSGRA